MSKRGLFLVSMMLLVLVLPVSAHEGREVGDYALIFGWRTEPALAGFFNGPELFIRPHAHEEDHEEGDSHDEPVNPLEGLEISLQVEATFGPASVTLPLRPDFNDPSRYIADLIPTRPGDYSFRVSGNIGDQEIDEIFSSADGQFGTVEPAADATFPDELPSIVDLLERIDQLEARLEALEAGR